ncbi:MAG: peptidase M16, partial [Thiotrichaceae bacterium]|nr:peptidase M16 [Thiotrichaceae bacterium]
GTNGIVYQQIILNFPDLSEEEYRYLPIFNFCFAELGCADKDYLQMQVEQSLVSGGIFAHSSLRGEIDDEQQVRGYYTISGKSLLRNHNKLTSLLKETFLDMRFDESDRIKELISQLRMRKESSITGSGHSLAMQAAISRMSPVAFLSHQNKGLASHAFIKELDTNLAEDPNCMAELQKQLSNIHNKLINSEFQFLLVCEEESYTACRDDIIACWDGSAIKKQSSLPVLSLEAIKQNVKQAWLTTTQVNFCAKAYSTVPVEHSDSAALTVLGGFLRNGFLHRSIREQGGAYGGGATQDSANACFKFFSYRDPRLSETLDDFEKSINWLLETSHDYLSLEEAILGVISSLDKPASPAGDAKQVFHNNLFGRTREQREKFRQRILAVTIDDLLNVARKYFVGQPASIAIITNHDHEGECCKLGLEVFNLN